MRLPLIRELTYPPGGRIPEVNGAGPYAVHMESGGQGTFGDRYSYHVWDPYGVIEWTAGGGWRSRIGITAASLPRDPWSGLEAALADDRVCSHAERPPFQSGAAGYFAYELASTLERLPAVAERVPRAPLARWALADVVVALDHHRRTAWAFSSGRPERGGRRSTRAQARLEAVCAAWETALAPVPAPASVFEDTLPPELEASLSPQAYRERFARLRALLVAGDLYQANLTVSFAAGAAVDARALHRALGGSNPAPYAALLGGEEMSVVSASPELFLSRRGRALVTRPIKGTRPRGRTCTEDRELASALRASAKDLAEHVMIVDVHRNDLGRVAEFGSVKVTARWELESFASVHHLTSTISARERAGAGRLAAVCAAFPAGSITGAPKIRAMEALAGLEPHARGVYTGALGWLDARGDFELAVAIRTATVWPERVEFPAGGGIVLDSDADAEYEEAWQKARGLWAAIQRATGPRMAAASRT